jgi:hypothetical protein
MSKRKKRVDQHAGHGHHSGPEVKIDDAVVIEMTKLDLHADDTVWVKVSPNAPFVRDWDALHMLQHGLQEVIDHQYPDLGLLVIVAPGDVSPIILRPAEEVEEGTPFDVEFETGKNED